MDVINLQKNRKSISSKKNCVSKRSWKAIDLDIFEKMKDVYMSYDFRVAARETEVTRPHGVL